MADTSFFRGVNILTAVISISTAAYLMPFVPNLLDGADKLYLEATTSKEILEKLYPEQIRQRLLNRESRVADDGEEMSSEGIELGSSSSGGGTGRKPNTKEQHTTVMRQRIQSFIHGRRHTAKIRDDSSNKDGRRDSKSSIGSDDDNYYTTTMLSKKHLSNPIADDFDQASIMFADISNFTYWSSRHTPQEVFYLLESIFVEFDRVAKEMGVYKLSTVGDCYIAVTGVPCPTVSFVLCAAYCYIILQCLY